MIASSSTVSPTLVGHARVEGGDMMAGSKHSVLLTDARRGPHPKKRPSFPRLPRVGHRLGPYRLCLEIGRGGMATVYLAQLVGRSGLHRFVALKCIRPEFAQNQSFVEMFLDEAQIASQIHHANVCSVLDFDQHDNIFCLAMEFLSGRTLTAVHHELLKHADRWDPLRHAGWVARVIEGACEGLHAAHELRNAHGELIDVVHRDVSPDNIFVTYNGIVKIVDFGIAYASEQHHETGTGIVKGKCSYLSPEVLAGQTPDRRADIWGVGVVTWELLTQRKLFEQPSGVATLRAISEMDIPPPSSVRPGLPALLDDIVMRALDRNPAKRYQTARELGRLLNRFLVENGLVVGLAEVAEGMQALFPEGQACTRQLLSLAEQMDNVSESNPTIAVDHGQESSSVSMYVVEEVSPADKATPKAKATPAAAHGSDGAGARRWAALWPMQNRPIAALAVAAVAVIGCSVAAGWGLRGSSSAAAAAVERRAAATAAMAAAAPAPLAAMPAATVSPTAQAARAPAPTGYAVEAVPVGVEDSGVLLRLRLVPDTAGGVAEREPRLREPAPRRRTVIEPVGAPAPRSANADSPRMRSEAKTAPGNGG
jgi:serine/threonine-protein kinase